MFRPGFRAFESAFRPIRCQTTKQHAQIRTYRQMRFGDERPRYSRFQTLSILFRRWAARPTFKRDLGVIGVGTGGFYLYNLEEVPVGLTLLMKGGNMLMPRADLWPSSLQHDQPFS